MKIRTSLLSINLLALAALLVVGAIALNEFFQTQNNWNSYRQNELKKGDMVLTFRDEMGYGGAIHNVKNFLITGDARYVDAFRENYTNVLSTIEQYQSLSHLTSAEKSALKNIQNMVDRYHRAIIRAQRLLADTRANAKLVGKLGLANSIFMEIGYGGMIRHYHHYLTTRDPKSYEQFKLHEESLKSLLQRYAAIRPISEQEQASIRRVREMLVHYSQSVEAARQAVKGKNSPSSFIFSGQGESFFQALRHLHTINQGEVETSTDVESIMDIDDEAYLAALTTLSDEVSVQTKYRRELFSQHIKSAGILIIIITLASVIGVLMAGAWVSSKISGHLVSLLVQANKIAEGQLTFVSRGLRSKNYRELDSLLPDSQRHQNELDALSQAFDDMTHHLEEVAKVADRVALGDFSKRTTLRGEQDIIGTSINKMAESLEVAVDQANRIAKGDYAENIVLHSRGDQLGLALQTMTDALRHAFLVEEEEKWISAGIAQLNDKMRSLKELDAFSQSVISFICRYTGFQKGVLYIRFRDEQKHAKENNINIAARHGFKIDDATEEKSIPELIHQVATDKVPLYLNDLDTEMSFLDSGLHRVRVIENHLLPLISGNECVGVLEIASVQESDKPVDRFLKLCSEPIGLTLTSVLSDMEVRRYLQESKNKSDSLEQQKRQIEKINTDLVEQALELERANEFKMEFFANVSHELRTPLNAIIGFSRRLVKKYQHSEEERLRSSLEAILSNGEKQLTLVNNLLDFSTLEAGNASLNFVKCIPSRVVFEIMQKFEEEAEKKNIKLDVHVEQDDMSLITDVGRFVQVLENLVSNAVKFSDSGTVSLSVSEGVSKNKQDCIYIEISDQGRGMSEEDLERVFKKYTTLDNHNDGKVTGIHIGLPITKEIVNVLGGTIAATSRLGEGSVFTVCLPKQQSLLR